MLFKYETKKLLSNYSVYAVLVLVLAGIAVIMYYEGYFGHDYCVRLDEFSCRDGKLITGEEAYLYNKKVAKFYQGSVDNMLLEKLHEAYKEEPYVEKDGNVYCDSTYRYFKSVFHINEEDYLRVEDAYRYHNVTYGFTGDWSSLFELIDKFFILFFVLIVLFVSPVFAGEYEKGVTALLSTTCQWKGFSFLKTKLAVVLLFVNIYMLLHLAAIVGIHVLRNGLEGAGISIQSVEQYSHSMLSMNLGEFAGYKIIAGVLGSNLISLLTVWVSLHQKSIFSCFLFTVFLIFAFDRNILLKLFPVDITDYLLAFAPINSYKMTIVAIVPHMGWVHAVGLGYIAFCCLAWAFIKRFWCSGHIIIGRRN